MDAERLGVEVKRESADEALGKVEDGAAMYEATNDMLDPAGQVATSVDREGMPWPSEGAVHAHGRKAVYNACSELLG